MDWKVEVITIPVTDVDRAIAFYRDKVGFHLDIDDSPWEGTRVVQLTPPGSACSIFLGGEGHDDTGLSPGSLRGLQIVVDDLDAARVQLVGNGIEASPIQHYTDSGLEDGKGGPWNSFVFFSDPDGNSWCVQERP